MDPVSFVLGGLTFTIVLFALVMLAAPKPMSKDQTRKAIEDIELLGSIKYRMKLVNELTTSQMDLIGQLDRPAASATHARHKNSIIAQLKEIEEQKTDIFRSIVDDGVDPIITAYDLNSGEPKEMRMSEALDIRSTETPQPETDPKNPRDNGTNLRLIKNEDDNAPDPINPTIH